MGNELNVTRLDENLLYLAASVMLLVPKMLNNLGSLCINKYKRTLRFFNHSSVMTNKTIYGRAEPLVSGLLPC